MPELVDQVARDRFSREWERNFAVSANAGSGKTTAISMRLATMARDPAGAAVLRRTAIVTYTRKAAGQIGQKARQELFKQLRREGARDLSPLDRLEQAFFGTIHSFCLMLAQTYGQAAGINLNPTLVAENDEGLWEEFLEDDSMQFSALGAAELSIFLRHVSLEAIFPLARELDQVTASQLKLRRVGPPASPSPEAFDRLLALPAKGNGAKNILASQGAAREWERAWRTDDGFLPLFEPIGSASSLVAESLAWMAPLKTWLAESAAILAAELAGRYRAWRFERGVQTYPDQIDAAMAVLRDDVMLDRIRSEGWRIVLDEAQDTDPQQFAVLVEVTRPAGAQRGAWPAAEKKTAPGPRPGHFCMVGDGQQAIYGSRADIGNFLRHVDAFRRGDSGELLEFKVTFRAPRAVIATLNATLPPAFGRERAYNFGIAPADDAPEPFLQVPFVPLAAGGHNFEGARRRFQLALPGAPVSGVDEWMAEEARQLATRLLFLGPGGVGARDWGEIAVLAPRNDWLVTIRKEFEASGLKVALQTKRLRNGDNPAYAWLTGLLAVCTDPENTFEWYGVLREVFAVSDALLAAELKRHGQFAWEEPEMHPEPLAGALACVRPFVLRANDEGRSLASFIDELAQTCALRGRLNQIDSSGTLGEELDRLMAEAAEAGLAGASPRDWWRSLLTKIDEGRPSGKPSGDAINLLTVHSAKGLEWPVVILAGWWRGIGKAPERGLRLIRGAAGDGAGWRVYFDQASLPSQTREARERERYRELTRLMYVALTRAMRVLIIPAGEDFGGRATSRPSFAELWGESLDSWPTLDESISSEVSGPLHGIGRPLLPASREGWIPSRPAPPLPARLLPHQLGRGADRVRTVRHDTGVEELSPPGGEEAIDYGLWWHETMEFIPWGTSAERLQRYAEQAFVRADAAGFGERGRHEWRLFVTGSVWTTLNEPRWTRLSELGVFAPLGPEGWIDGVVDLVMHDPLRKELWIIDWKTNRRRDAESNDAFLERLRTEYTSQLRAYGRGLRPFFPNHVLRGWLYASALGGWVEISAE